mgnify:CR=1 FL=1
MEQDYDYEKMASEGYECECESAGFCPLLAMRMDDRLHNFCKTDARSWKLLATEVSMTEKLKGRETKDRKNSSNYILMRTLQYLNSKSKE